MAPKRQRFRSRLFRREAARRMAAAFPAKKRRLQQRMRKKNVRTGGFLGMEMKFLDCAWNGVVINSGGSDAAAGELQPSSGCTNCISCPVQGTGEQERDGRKFTIKSIWISGAIDTTANQAADDVTNIDGVWLALVWDKQANAGTVTSEEVFVNPGTSGTNMMPQPLRNLQHSSRFSVVASQFIPAGGAWSMPDGTNTASLSPQMTTYVNLSWKGSVNVETKGTTANVNVVNNNAFHLIGYAGSTSFTPVFRGKSRMRFMG